MQELCHVAELDGRDGLMIATVSAVLLVVKQLLGLLPLALAWQRAVDQRHQLDELHGGGDPLLPAPCADLDAVT